MFCPPLKPVLTPVARSVQQICSNVVGIAITLTLTGNATVDEGSVYTLNIAASGDDAAGITGYTVNWGDGSATEAATAGDNTHTYDDGQLNASIVVTALHPNGNKTGSKSVTVGNVVPTATITGDSTATVDVAYTATISSVTDPGDDTVSTYRVYWGDGSSDDYTSAGAKTHTYTSAGSGLTVRLDLIDEDGTHTNVDSYSLDVSATVTPLHSLDLTTAPSASNAFDDYGLALPRTVTDYSGRIVQIPADAVPMGGLRPVRNLNTASETLVGWTGSNATISDAVTVVYSAANGYIYKSLSGLNTAGVFVFSATVSTVAGTKNFKLGFGGASSGVLTATTTPQRFSFAGTPGWTIAYIYSATQIGTLIVEDIQIQEITHRADLSTAPDEYVSTDDDYGTGVNGFRYFDTELANTVASNVVTEITGDPVEGWGDWQPEDTNYADCTHDWSGGADTITLTATGYYTLWLEGTAQVSIAAGTATITGAGAATEGSPVTINCTATGTITLTLDSGTLDEWGAYQIIQLSDGTVPTAFIPSTGSASRPAMSPAPTISGLTGTEDARLTVKGLGPNLITNGGFDTDSDWAKGAGWSIADGKASANLSSLVNLSQTIAGLASGKKYVLIFSITERTSGSLNPYVGGTFTGTSRNALGRYAEVIETAATSSLIYFRSTDFVGSVDDVELFEIDPTDTTSRTIDLNNIDGEFDMFEDIPIKVLSIDVYNDGERPD